MANKSPVVRPPLIIDIDSAVVGIRMMVGDYWVPTNSVDLPASGMPALPAFVRRIRIRATMESVRRLGDSLLGVNNSVALDAGWTPALPAFALHLVIVHGVVRRVYKGWERRLLGGIGDFEALAESRCDLAFTT